MPIKELKNVGIRLDKFKMDWIKDGKIIVLIGSRGRGKSTILLDYLYHNADIPYATCIAPTDQFNFTFTPHIPSRFIFSEYTPELVAKFLKRQKMMSSKKKEAELGYGDPVYKDVDCRGILIMDDCLAENKGWRADKALKWIFFNGRHANITFVLTMQYQIGITPDYRSNIDWVFLCKENKRNEREKLYKNYTGIFPSFTMFEQIFMSCTSDKKCMVINMLSESDKLEEQVFWFRATLRENFRVCYDSFWENNEYYLRKRLSHNDPTGVTTNNNTGQNNKMESDDFYKYVGGRGKIRFNLDMSDEDQEKDQDQDEEPMYEDNQPFYQGRNNETMSNFRGRSNQNYRYGF